MKFLTRFLDILPWGLLALASVVKSPRTVYNVSGQATVNAAPATETSPVLSYVFVFFVGMVALYLLQRVWKLRQTVDQGPSPEADQKASLVPVPHATCEVTLEAAESLLAAYCERNEAFDFAVKKRTLMRWEKGESKPVAGYSVRCRETMPAFVEWMKGYVIACKAEQAPKKAFVRFKEVLHSPK